MANSKYPKGLFYLVFTEFWERFGYYLMIGIFTLYMITDTAEGGLGWDNADAADIYGTFIAAAYLTPFMGGLLADLKLGYRFSITLGGILMGIGYCMLAIPQTWAFYTSLVIMVVGNGFFKPNISTLLGNLYNDPEFKHKKDTGYNIFYMGINLGAFICTFIAAIMRNKIGWGAAFIAAGIGMFIGSEVSGYVKDKYTAADPSGAMLTNWLNVWLVPSGIAAAALVFLLLFFKDKKSNA
jgi:POT family proton-dependent oligopeptide transporter